MKFDGLGAILAGGKSRRMGVPKAAMRMPDGRRMLDAAILALAPLCRRIVMIGGESDWLESAPARVEFLPDSHPGEGPLAAIETALSRYSPYDLLVVGCDQPFLAPDLLQQLIHQKSARPTVFGERNELQPLPGYYPAALLPLIRDALGDGIRSIRTFLHNSGVRVIPADDEVLHRIRSINTPEQLNALKKRKRYKDSRK